MIRLTQQHANQNTENQTIRSGMTTIQGSTNTELEQPYIIKRCQHTLFFSDDNKI